MKKYILSLFLLTFGLITLNSCRDEITSPSETEIEGSGIKTNLKEIIQPKEAELWIPGNAYTIKWKVNKNFDRVNISLVRKFNHILVISQYTENDGSFRWTIPSNIPRSHHYRIKLSTFPGTSDPVLSDEFFILDSQ
jgi:hypothetical protein